MERWVAGTPTVDIGMLRRISGYSSCAPSDTIVRQFWEVLEEMEEEDKVNFLR